MKSNTYMHIDHTELCDQAYTLSTKNAREGEWLRGVDVRTSEPAPWLPKQYGAVIQWSSPPEAQGNAHYPTGDQKRDDNKQQTKQY